MVSLENRELELKFIVHHPGAMRHALLHLGVEDQSHGEVRELNVIFENADNTLNSSGRRLRLRHSDRAILTYKERPQYPLPGVKDLVEIEIEVADFEQMKKILNRLGFREEMVYENYRQKFRLGEVKIDLDRVPIGAFMEIEGQRSQILSIARRLGLDPQEAIAIGYPEIIRKVCQVEGLDWRKCTFDVFPKDIDPDKYSFPRIKGC